VFLVDQQRVESVRPDAVVERQRLLARIGEALHELPYPQQVAFAMCDLEQLPGTEVARALGIPEGTLWRRVYQARKALRAVMERG
jgi:RNA polymerase sigma factor (sigma-70 family)